MGSERRVQDLRQAANAKAKGLHMLNGLKPAERILADYMSELSEAAWSAGWMKDLEHTLWRAVQEGPFHYGHLDLTPTHIERLRLLSAACGGWIRFDYTTGETSVRLAEWKQLYEVKRGNGLREWLRRLLRGGRK